MTTIGMRFQGADFGVDIQAKKPGGTHILIQGQKEDFEANIFPTDEQATQIVTVLAAHLGLVVTLKDDGEETP